MLTTASGKNQQQVLIRALQNAALYGQVTGAISVLETHISWVILTGEFAYKIKKAVDFGFLDFSTLEKRLLYCREELRLNRRFAPDLYLDVISITGTAERPALEGAGAPLEYAVKMRQFPQQGLLSTIAAGRKLESGHIDELAHLVADSHGSIDVAAQDSGYGNPDDIHHWVSENFEQIRPVLTDPLQRQQLDQVEAWCRREYRLRRPVMLVRLADGFVRECHGDLHLGNMVMIDNRITAFDCIEFNPRLRWIDIMSEAAFVMMDIQDRGYSQLAYRFLNGYLQHSGDYAGVVMLHYYLVYRALVRAKVAVLRLGQGSIDAAGNNAIREEYASYMALAGQYTAPAHPALVITHGVSGTGKSWCASRLAERCSAIQIRSDVERKRLYGYSAAAGTQSGIESGIYAPAASQKTYRRLAQLAAAVIDGGYPVIVDAAFLQQAERRHFRELARDLGVPFVLLHFDADADRLHARLRQRQAAGSDASEAGIEVLAGQLQAQEPLLPEEMSGALCVDTDRVSIERLAGQLTEKISA